MPEHQGSLTRVERGVAVAYGVLSLPIAALLLLVAGFGSAPTSCPDAGGSYLCTTPEAQSWTFGGFALLLALFVGLGVAALLVRPRRRVLGLLGASLAAGLAAVVGIQLVAATWA